MEIVFHARCFTDDFIDPSHTEQLYDACGSEKTLARFDGDHNSDRPQSFFDAAGKFLARYLLAKQGHEMPPLSISDALK